MYSDREMFLYCGIYERYHDKSLDAFNGDSEALVVVRKYLDNLPKMKASGIGLYLNGIS